MDKLEKFKLYNVPEDFLTLLKEKASKYENSTELLEFYLHKRQKAEYCFSKAFYNESVMNLFFECYSGKLFDNYRFDSLIILISDISYTEKQQCLKLLKFEFTEIPKVC